jgi:hypothetical protein
MWAFQGYLGGGLGPIFDPKPANLPLYLPAIFCHPPAKNYYHHQLTPPSADTIQLTHSWCGP